MPTLEPPFDGATATIIIEGLAICSFSPNPTNKRADIAFLRPTEPEHRLALIIEDTLPKHNPVWIIPIDLDDKIVISARGAAAEPLATYPNLTFTPGPFDRKAGTNHQKDFRWTLGIDTIAGELGLTNPTSDPSPNPIPLTFAYIYDAVFYTKDISDGDVLLLPAAHPDPGKGFSPSPASTLGKGNFEVAGDIVCDPSGSVILRVIGADGAIKGEHEMKDADKVAGKPHLIRLKNVEVPKPKWEKDDFGFYYQALGLLRGYEVWSLCEANQAHERTAGTCRCQCSSYADLSSLPGTNYDASNLRP